MTACETDANKRYVLRSLGRGRGEKAENIGPFRTPPATALQYQLQQLEILANSRTTKEEEKRGEEEKEEGGGGYYPREIGLEIDPLTLIARRVVHVIVIHLMRIDNSARSKTISKKFPSNFLRASGEHRKLRKSPDVIFRKNTQLSQEFILAREKRKRGREEGRQRKCRKFKAGNLITAPRDRSIRLCAHASV